MDYRFAWEGGINEQTIGSIINNTALFHRSKLKLKIWVMLIAISFFNDWVSYLFTDGNKTGIEIFTNEYFIYYVDFIKAKIN